MIIIFIKPTLNWLNQKPETTTTPGGETQTAYPFHRASGHHLPSSARSTWPRTCHPTWRPHSPFSAVRWRRTNNPGTRSHSNHLRTVPHRWRPRTHQLCTAYRTHHSTLNNPKQHHAGSTHRSHTRSTAHIF